MVSTFLVFFMQAGFALVETGFTHAKNVGTIIMKKLIDVGPGSIFSAVAWTSITAYVVFKNSSIFHKLCVSRDEEIKG